MTFCMRRHGDHYRWQKVTSCIHNLLGGQRWVDLYGEMIINNLDKCTCKLTFVKVPHLPSRPRLAPVIITSFPLFRQAIGAPRNTLSMATCTTVMGSKFVTCLAPGTRPSSAGRTLTPPNAYGELVSQIMLQK